MKLKLQELNKDLQTEFLDYLSSFKDEKIVPMSIDIKNKSFDEFLEHLHLMKTNPPRLLVPATNLFFVNEETNEIIGAINIRHFLSAQLLNFGGHIGYSIKKSYRGQGLAKTMLKMAKPFLESVELKEILICCDNMNIASQKTIQSFNAELESEIEKIEDGKDIIIQRYWINLDNI